MTVPFEFVIVVVAFVICAPLLQYRPSWSLVDCAKQGLASSRNRISFLMCSISLSPAVFEYIKMTRTDIQHNSPELAAHKAGLPAEVASGELDSQLIPSRIAPSAACIFRDC